MPLWLTFSFDFNVITKTARSREQEKLLPSEAQLQLLHFVWTYCSLLPPCSALVWPPASVSSTRLSPACCFRPSALVLRPVDTYLSELEAIEEASSVIMSNIVLSLLGCIWAFGLSLGRGKFRDGKIELLVTHWLVPYLNHYLFLLVFSCPSSSIPT